MHPKQPLDQWLPTHIYSGDLLQIRICQITWDHVTGRTDFNSEAQCKEMCLLVNDWHTLGLQDYNTSKKQTKKKKPAAEGNRADVCINSAAFVLQTGLFTENLFNLKIGKASSWWVRRKKSHIFIQTASLWLLIFGSFEWIPISLEEPLFSTEKQDSLFWWEQNCPKV